MAGAALLIDAVYRRHATGSGHPERAERIDALERAFESTGLAARLTRLTPRAATEDELALCHSRAYIETAKREIAAGARQLSTGDTAVGSDSWHVAVRASGGVLEAVDAVFAGRATSAFCAVRPPGHHATADLGMGFCIVNNVAVAARYAQQRHRVERVLIVDWDVHHGNGTQEIFYRDGSVLFFSTHQYPWYPGTGLAEERGEGRGEGRILNCPLPAGSGKAEVLDCFRRKLLPAAGKFEPDLVLISAGFDARAGDPLGRFTLSDADFAELTRLVLDIADRHAGGRVVSVLEGGYALDGLASATVAHVRELAR